MKCLAIAVLALSVASGTVAQTLYVDSVFSEVDKTTHVYYTDQRDTLQLDHYAAAAAQAPTPLLVFVHGGGFSSGARDDKKTVDFAHQLARRGYAVAAVSYRLTMSGIGFGCDVKAGEKVAAIDAASHDVGLAVKHLLDDREAFRIDQDKVILAGSSAGAEAVLNMAYVYEDKNLPPDFSYAGVISMAGAVVNIDKIDRTTAIPTQLFHGTGDRLVPYGTAPHHYCHTDDPGYLMLYGSEPIAERLQGLGVSYYLYTVLGGAHRWAGLPLTQSFDEIVDFLYHDVMDASALRQTHRTVDDLP